MPFSVQSLIYELVCFEIMHPRNAYFVVIE